MSVTTALYYTWLLFNFKNLFWLRKPNHDKAFCLTCIIPAKKNQYSFIMNNFYTMAYLNYCNLSRPWPNMVSLTLSLSLYKTIIRPVIKFKEIPCYMRDSAYIWCILLKMQKYFKVMWFFFFFFFFFLNIMRVKNTESRFVHGTIKRTAISCKKISSYMRDSTCRWLIVGNTIIF